MASLGMLVGTSIAFKFPFYKNIMNLPAIAAFEFFLITFLRAVYVFHVSIIYYRSFYILIYTWTRIVDYNIYIQYDIVITVLNLDIKF